MGETVEKEVAEASNRAGLIRLKPPRIALVLVLIDVALHYGFRNRFGRHFSCLFCGLTLIALGFVVMLWAWWLFRKRETAICPTASATVLVESGPFRVTRNPMYVGMTLMLLGAAWVLGTLPTLFAPVVFFVLMNTIFIPFEEQRLSTIFGQRYAEYSGRVRRWL